MTFIAMKTFSQVAALLAAAFCFSTGANAQSSTRKAKTWRVFPVSSLQKLTAETPGVLQNFSSQAVELQAARGEWESFQVVVSASDKPLRFSVAATSFATQLGRFIARDNIQIYRENYVRVTHPSGNRVLDSRWWPDALIPLNDQAVIEVAANRSIVLWVAVHVPREAEAGQYFAALDIVPQAASQNNGAKTSPQTSKLDATRREVPLALNVSPAVLPAPTMRANVAVYYDSLRDWYGKNVSPLNDEQFAQLKRNYYDFLLDYGLNAYDLPVAWQSEEAANYLRDSRVRSVRLPPQDSPEFDVALQQLKSTGTLAKAYAYRIDEPSPEQYESVRAATAKLHESNAQLKHCVTVAPNETLRGAVDIWCPNIGDFFGLGHLDLDDLKRERQSGRETWWYTMVEPKSPYPTWLLDDDASAVRVYGWMMARHEISGFVYSMAHGWGPKPFDNLESFEGTNGDGTLLYPTALTDDPTAKLRPIPSIRLMLLRDAMEDYELLHSLTEPKRRAIIEYSKSDSLLFPDAEREHFTSSLQSQRKRLLALVAGQNVSIPRRAATKEIAPTLRVGESAIPFAAVAPKIDGEWKDAIWNDKAQFHGAWIRVQNDTARWPSTSLWLAHDAKFLYVALRAEENQRAGAIAVELAPINASQRWRFVASASGKVSVQRHTREGRFAVESGNWKIARRNVPASQRTRSVSDGLGLRSEKARHLRSGFVEAAPVEAAPGAPVPSAPDKIEYSIVEMAIPLELLGDVKRFRLNAWRRVWKPELQAFYTIKALADANDTTQMPLVSLAPR